MIYLFLTIIGIMLLCVMLMSINVGKKEHFQWEPKWEGAVSRDCYTEKPGNCLKYSNCGICLNNCDKDGNFKKSKCMPGDINGPLFTETCNKWKYSNYDTMYDETVTDVTDPWSKRYTTYESVWPSPVAVQTLQ